MNRLEMERFMKSANLNIVHIPYKGGAGPAVTGMLGGETQIMFVTLSSAISFIQAGKLKGFGVSTTKRVDALPQVPTMIEAGFPDMVSSSWQGIFVPRGRQARSSTSSMRRSSQRWTRQKSSNASAVAESTS